MIVSEKHVCDNCKGEIKSFEYCKHHINQSCRIDLSYNSNINIPHMYEDIFYVDLCNDCLDLYKEELKELANQIIKDVCMIIKPFEKKWFKIGVYNK